MFLLHFLCSTKVSLAYFAQLCIVLEIRTFKEGRSRGGPKGGPKGLYNDKLKLRVMSFYIKVTKGRKFIFRIENAHLSLSCGKVKII